MQAPEVGHSVYDLREDEQLALAMQQSLADALETASNCADPDSAAGGAPGRLDVAMAPDGEGDPEEVPMVMVPGADLGGGGPLPSVPVAPPVAPPEPEGERHDRSADPEWAGAAEEAAGGAAFQQPVPPPPHRPAGSGAVFPPEAPPRPANSRILDEVVQRSLELAKARQFDEAERCLAQFAGERPELATSREMTAAREAVAMCKLLNGA
mmetsp:Transcript_12472/g.29724  ORF Transcript_12472/g.29724 Transcript_12472/m.29724 type:complete len:210 (+) Transcript_12472:103-732(+)